MNQRIALPLLKKSFGVGERLGFVFMVGRGEINESLTQHTTHAGRFGFFGNGIFEVIHVRERRDPRTNLLRCCEARSPADKFFVNVFLFSGKDVFVQPVIERDIIVQAAK